MREICFLDNGGASVEGEGHKFRPWGLLDGHDGATAELVLRRATGELITLPSKVPHMPMYLETSLSALVPPAEAMAIRSSATPRRCDRT